MSPARRQRGAWLGALVCLGALALSAPAQAQAPPPPPPPAEAEVAEVRHERERSSLFEMKVADAPDDVLREERRVTLSARYRRARTPEGWRVRFAAWRRVDRGRDPDESLSGAEVRFLEAKEAGGRPRWELTQERELSDAAQRYLDELAAELAQPLAGLLLGGERGKTRWTPDLARLAPRLVPRTPFDAEGSRVSGSRQADPEAERATGQVELDLLLRRLPGNEAPLVKGGHYRARFELSWPGARRPEPETTSWRFEASFQGEARAQQPDGTAVKLRAKAHERERLVVTPQE